VDPRRRLLGAVLLLLVVPPFALIGLAVVAPAALAALVALAGAVLAAPYLIVRNVRRRFAKRHQSTQGSVQIAPAITQ
jgi:positive regulator of sigma E activity